MLDIRELQEKIRQEALARGGDISAPPPVLSGKQRLQQIIKRCHGEFLLRLLLSALRPWRGFPYLLAGQQSLEQRQQALEQMQHGQAARQQAQDEKQQAQDALLALLQEEIEASRKRQVQEMNRLTNDVNLARQQNVLLGYELHRKMDVSVSPPAPNPANPAAENGWLDNYLLAFADACRGDERDIRAELQPYLAYITKQQAGSVEFPVLDLGCGRGEWLAILRDNNLHGQGVDTALIMAEHCRTAGLQAEQDDALRVLAQRPEGSLGAVTAFHLIEHLPFATLYRLFEESYRALRSGGLIIFETPNPENPLVGSHTFYHDPTHRNPLTPTAMEFLARFLGFAEIEILRLHPYPESARIAEDSPLSARFNGLFCGPQDFTIIAVKP
jgi:O-antigen chain-terminating methyltransferase